MPATSCVGLTLGAENVSALPPALRGAVRRWLLCCRIGRGITRMVAWDLMAALLLTHPALLEIEPATVTLGPRGVIAATPGRPHALVRGLADPDAARAAVLSGLGAPGRPGLDTGKDRAPPDPGAPEPRLR